LDAGACDVDVDCFLDADVRGERAVVGTFQPAVRDGR
jgi:hypothetical protein